MNVKQINKQKHYKDKLDIIDWLVILAIITAFILNVIEYIHYGFLW